MEIKSISCDQFAGLKGREIVFADGMNLIIGENESGKSSIAELIYQTLFQKASLDGRMDTGFVDRFFPKREASTQGNVIDGVLCFLGEDGAYKLTKEWEKGAGTVRLVMPDGTVVKGQREVDEALVRVLHYGRGIYDEVIFSSQKRQLRAVELLLRDAKARKKNAFSDDLRSDLAAVLRRTVLETGGVSLDKIEKKLDELLTLYAARWDEAAELPEGGIKRGIENKWRDATTREADAGRQAILLRAWYDLKETEFAKEEAERAERRVEDKKTILREAEEKKRAAQQKQKDFLKYKSLIEQHSLLRSQCALKQEQLTDRKKAAARIPELEKNLNDAAMLREKTEQAKLHKEFLAIFRAKTELEQRKAAMATVAEVPDEDVREAEALSRSLERLEGRLAGLDLTARLTKLGDQEISIRTATGEATPAKEGTFTIQEAVEIRVPGVMELSLAPKGVDIGAVQEEIASAAKKYTKILKKNQAKDLRELREKQQAYRTLDAETKLYRNAFEKALGDRRWEEIEKEHAQIPADIGELSVYQDEKQALCGMKSLDAFLGGLEAERAQYLEKYGTEKELRVSVAQLETELKAVRAKEAALQSIPAEYASLDDPEGYALVLNEEAEAAENEAEQAREELSRAERELKDQSAEEYAEELQQKRAIFESRKAEYAHWKHIARVFHERKAAMENSDALAGLEESFRKYLSLLTEGNLRLLAMDESFETRLFSGDSRLTYEILSEGTKDTISLAFRLAMLSCLYPDGGGLAIFDDPFTEMDEKRTEKACKLLREFAGKHQIIFITCDNKYRRLLGGEVIELA